MKNLILSLMLLTFTSSAFATVAILCGNPAEVDENEKTASLHFIFEHDQGRIYDLRTYFLGKAAKPTKIKSDANKFYVSVTNPAQTIVFDKEVLNLCGNGGEEIFTMNKIQNSQATTIEDCRCFED